MNWDKVWTWSNWERLLVGNLFISGDTGGLLLTLEIGLSAIVLSTVLGAAIGIMRHSKSLLLWFPAVIYIQSLRNIPMLILIFWAFFVPPYFGIETSKFVSVLIALTLFTAAYIAEIVRGGIRAVPDVHIQAARALGMSRLQIQMWIMLPQAFYNMLPAISGRYIVAIKNTSLAFLIGLADLTEIGKQIGNRLMTSPVEVYLTLLILYFAVNRLVSFAARSLEDRRKFASLFLRI